LALAIFDLDETLISIDSDHAWGEFLEQAGLVDADAHRKQNDAFYEDYKLGQLDIDAYLSFACEVLAQYEMAELKDFRAKFIEDRILPVVLPKAKALVESHRQQGDELLVITSTSRFVTEPIVALFGIDNLIAPEPEIVDDRYTGNIVGTPSYREGKVTRLNDWLQGRPFTMAGSYFYSDSHNDLPLLKVVDHPVAVDPDDTLRQVAASAAWQTISLRP
jgi:HAD superfamily hydrolase (TIGR01490 family)